MSATGSVMAAVADSDQIFVSTDTGETWNGVEQGRQWRAISVSGDGTKIFAAAWGINMWYSTNSGNTWSGRAFNRGYTGVSLAGDASIVVAVQNGKALVGTGATLNSFSDDAYSGAGFTSVSLSNDGSQGAATSGGGSGTVWWFDGTTKQFSQTSSPTGDYAAVCVTGDGTKALAATAAGTLYTNENTGAGEWTARESARSWKAVACARDGSKFYAVANNGKVVASP